MSQAIKQVSFSAGEVSPSLYARTDLNRYEIGLRTMRNFIGLRQGGATNRPGTKYVDTAKNAGAQVRLIPFIFNETGIGQSYVLEFGNQYVAFYQNGATVVSAPNTPYTIVSQYLQADLQSLNFQQSNDVLTITHQNYPPTELRRTAPTSWAFTPVTYDGTAPIVTGVTPSGGTVGSVITNYIVTAVMANGDESASYTITGGNIVPSPTAPIVLTIIFSAPNQVSFNIYKNDTAITGASLQDPFGYIGSIAAGVPVSFSDTGIAPDYTTAPPVSGALKAIVAAGRYPKNVGFVQQRRVFSDTPLNPVGVWESEPGSPSNFTLKLPVADDGSIAFSIAGEEVNEIRAVLEQKFMLIMTAGAELFVQGNGSGVVTPSAINASTQSQYGCGSLRPLKVGDTILFNQALGSFIRDFSFDFAIDGYRGNDLTIYSSHLVEGYTLVDWAYQKVPDSIIWSVRSDGVLLGLTYLREQQVLSWHRHDFTDGFVENVCSIPENGSYALYLSIRRVINGSTVRYIERMSSRIWSDPIDATYLDCFSEYDGRNTTPTTMTLTPKTIYIKTGVNDGIQFSETGFTTPNYLAVIPSGLYTPATLAIAAGVAMTAASQSGVTYTGSLSGGLMVISNSIGVGSSFQLLFNNTFPNFSRSAYRELGFYPPAEYSGSGGSAAAGNPPLPVLFSDTSDAYKQSLTLTSSASYFTSDMVGKEIFVNDDLFDSSYGQSGNQLRLSIQSISDSQNVLVYPNTEVDSEFQNIPTSNWSLAVQSVTGLDYLEGQEVSVWADRYVVGSPFNRQITTVYTVTGGTITLDKPYSVIYVGLPMISDLETLDIDTAAGESMMGRMKKIGNCSAYVYNTRTFFLGTQNPDTDSRNTDDDLLYELMEFKRGEETVYYDSPPPLVTDQDYVLVDGRWNSNGRVFLRNVDPSPVTILAISPNVSDNIPDANNKRV